MGVVYFQNSEHEYRNEWYKVVSHFVLATKMRQMEERIKELEEKDTNVDLHREYLIFKKRDCISCLFTRFFGAIVIYVDVNKIFMSTGT